MFYQDEISVLLEAIRHRNTRFFVGGSGKNWLSDVLIKTHLLCWDDPSSSECEINVLHSFGIVTLPVL